MYQIILAAALFTNQHIPTGNFFITPEACTLTANKLTAQTGHVYKCEPVKYQNTQEKKV